MSDTEQADDAIRLTASDGVASVSMTIDVAAGARVAQVEIRRGDDIVTLLAERPPAVPATAWSTGWGSFAMAPWAGRIRHGRFHFLDEEVRLDLNHDDSDDGGGGPIEPPESAPIDQISNRHSIHGTVFSRSWTIDRLEASRVAMHCDLVGALGWPYPGVARQRIDLAPGRATFELSVESADAAVFPASIGWHPWFATCDRLDWSPLAMYRRGETGLPRAELVPPPPGPWDDCFVNRAPVVLRYDRALVPAVTVTSDCDHWVVFDELAHATCVEPQTGPPDAPTLRPDIVGPDHALRRTMTWNW